MKSFNLIRPMELAILAMLAMLVCAPATAYANAASDRAERARIERERNAAEQAYAAKDRECRTHFEVTSCVDAAQGERRESLKRLRVQQELLDEAARRERAAQRLESIRQKESGADSKQREAMARQQQKQLKAAAGLDSNESAASAASAASASGASRTTPKAADRSPSTRLPRDHSAARPQTTAASAAERAEDYSDRQRDVEAHRKEVAARHAERAAKGKKSIPLPLPAEIPASIAAPIAAPVPASMPAASTHAGPKR